MQKITSPDENQPEATLPIKEIIDEEFYAVIAPDGEIQYNLIGEELEMLRAFNQLLYKKGVSRSLNELIAQGFGIAKVKVTIKAA